MDYERSFLEKVVQGLQNTAAKIGRAFEQTKGPVGFVLDKLLAVGRFYKNRIWKHARNKEGNLTWLRTSMVLFFTVALFWIVPTTLHATWQGALMATTMKRETIYLNNAEEVDPEGNVHAIRGCANIPCSESDAIYFRVRPTLAHTIYALVDHGRVFYPDYTASVVAPGVNECEVVSYGIRIKALMRGWDVFPDMLDATCTPYNAPQL